MQLAASGTALREISKVVPLDTKCRFTIGKNKKSEPLVITFLSFFLPTFSSSHHPHLSYSRSPTLSTQGQPQTMVNYQFQAFANSNNTLLVGKMIAVTSLGLYAGTALTFNTVIMPSLRKFSSSSSLAIWHENFQAGKRTCSFFFSLSLVLIISFLDFVFYHRCF